MKNQQAFSLLELSIVITVIAFITSSIYVTKHLNKTSQLNKVILEVTNYHSYMDVFKIKFDYYAGDFPDAGAMWGNDCNGSSSGSDNCSGDGDGIIDATDPPAENSVSWQHLIRSNILLDVDSFAGSVWQDNVPASALNNTSIYLYESKTKGVTVSLRSRADWFNAISHRNAYRIDSKIDDGVLDAGNVFGECNGSITTYDLTAADIPKCGLKFY